MSDDFLDAVRSSYGLPTLSPASDPTQPLLRNFIPDLSAHPALAFRRRSPASDGARHFSDHYGELNRTDVHVIVSVSEYENAAQSQDGLVRFLSHCMGRLSRCSDHGLNIGELCFCGMADPVCQIVFTRRNIKIDIASVGSSHISVPDLAVVIDEQIRNALAAANTFHITKGRQP